MEMSRHRRGCLGLEKLPPSGQFRTIGAPPVDPPAPTMAVDPEPESTEALPEEPAAVEAKAMLSVDFDGDAHTVVTAPDGEHYAVLARLCEPFGVDVGGQRRKLETLPWACWKMIFHHDATGRKQKLFCLHIRSVAGWLFTLNAGKVAEAVRPKLVKYQRECADHLADKMFGMRGAVAPVLDRLSTIERRLVSRRRAPACGARRGHGDGDREWVAACHRWAAPAPHP
jgi:P22_AR N-terminal domain